MIVPGEGFGFGRASGWLLDAVACSYALGDSQSRQQLRPFLRRIVDVAEQAQSPCGGYLQAQLKQMSEHTASSLKHCV